MTEGREAGAMQIRRVFSGAVAAVYVGVLAESPEVARTPILILVPILALLLPLAFIWFSEEIGSYVPMVSRTMQRTGQTPGWPVATIGLVLLLWPAVDWVITRRPG